MASHCPVCTDVLTNTSLEAGTETCPRCGRLLSESQAGAAVEPIMPSLHSPATANTSSLDQSHQKSNVRSHVAGELLLGRYELVQELGRGTFGEVWLAHDEQLKRQVAIKIPRYESTQAADRAAFLREAQVAAGLKHPGIVAIYDVQQLPDGRVIVVMEYIGGKTLAVAFKESRVSFEQAANWGAQLADALHAAHRQSLVHRDLKPANVLLDGEGKLHITDFGLAVTDDLQRSMAGEVAGTFSYMSPEQIRGEAHRLDGRTDIWSLGVMLYEMLAGKRPFGGNRQQLCDEIEHREPRPLRQLDERIPVELERICLKCLAKHPDARYTTAADLAADLRSWQRQQSSRTQWQWAVVGGGVMAVALIAIIVLSFFPSALFPAPKQDKSSSAANKALLVDALTLPSFPVPPVELPEEFSELQEQLHAARAAKQEKEEFNLLMRTTNLLTERGHFKEAELAARRLVELSGNDPGLRPLALSQWGISIARLGAPERAIPPLREAAKSYHEMYEKLKRLPDTPKQEEDLSYLARMVGLGRMRLGNAHKELGQKQLAREAYTSAEEILAAHDRKSELITLLQNYGGLESASGNYDRALELLERGVALAREVKEDESVSELLINVGNTHSRAGDEVKAEETYRQISAQVTPKSSYELRSKLLINWSQTLLELERRDEAKEKLLELQTFARPNDELAQKLIKMLPALQAGK